MRSGLAVILRFNGDSDDLLGRFEQARKSWIEAHEDGYNPPTLFAVCRAKQGIVVITGWENVEDHKAFGQRMDPHLRAAGMDGPDDREHLKIDRLGWNTAPTQAS